jgi:hypothetical protein
MTHGSRVLIAALGAAALLPSTLAYTLQLGDTTAPRVSVTAPALDAHLLGTVTVSANATDAEGVAAVQFVLDGDPLGDEDTVAPFSVSWDTTAADVGSHILSARARDAAGNVGDSELRPVVVVRPDVTAPIITASPVSGTVFGPSVTVTLSSNEPATIFYTTDGSGPSEASSRGASPLILGPFSTTTTVRYFATDAAGNDSDAASATYIRNPDMTAPVARPPRESFSASDAPLSGVPVRLTWSATDAESGVARYELQRSLDGGTTWRAESLSSPLRTTKDFLLTAGTSYRFRVRAVDVAGNVGTYATAPAFRPYVYEDSLANVAPTLPNLVYAGTWTTQTTTVATGGTRRFASLAGARATFTFTGRAIAWVAERGPGKGQADVWINDVFAGTVDLYNSSTRPRYIAFRRTFTASGPHTIQIRVRGTKRADATGTRIDLDSFLVTR